MIWKLYDKIYLSYRVTTKLLTVKYVEQCDYYKASRIFIRGAIIMFKECRVVIYQYKFNMAADKNKTCNAKLKYNVIANRETLK